MDLIKILLDAGYHVTLRPHPMSIKKSSKIIKKIREKFEENADFILDTNISSFEQLFSSYALITDWSGIGFEYAFVCERPVIYVDVPHKNLNPDYKKIQCEPLEISIRNLIGKVISPNELESIPKIIESTYENIDLFKTKVREVRNQTIFNFGQSGAKGAQEIVKILLKEESWFNYISVIVFNNEIVRKQFLEANF